MDEIWRDIKGYEGLYQVSSLGKVKSLFRYKKVLKPLKVGAGYFQVQLCRRKKAKAYLIHRLVANHFIDNTENKLHVNHIDGDKANNSVHNLEWTTPSENEKHSYQVLRKRPNKSRSGKYGKECYNAIAVNQLSISGEIINTYESSGMAERVSGIRHGNIWAVLKGRRHTAGGFKWEYKQ